MYNQENQIEAKDLIKKIQNYLNYFYIKKYFILLFSLAFAMLISLINEIRDETFTANLTFIVEEEGPVNSLGSMSSIASQFGLNIGSTSQTIFSNNNIKELILSRKVISKVLMDSCNIKGEKDLIIEHYLSKEKIRNEWEKKKDFKEINFNKGYLSRQHDSIINLIYVNIIENTLEVDFNDSESNVLTVSFTSNDEYLSKFFVEKLIDQVSKMYISNQTLVASNRLAFIHSRADSVFIELKNTEKRLAKVQDVNQRIVKFQARLKELQLIRDVEILNTTYLEILKNLELSKLTLLNSTPIIKIVDKPVLPLPTNKASMLKAFLISCFLGMFTSVIFFGVKKLYLDLIS